MQGVELESEAPTFRIIVVLLEDVDTADVLPEIDWLLDGLDVEKAQQGGLAGS